MRFEFDWVPSKAENNRRKHGVTFEDAMGVFADRLALWPRGGAMGYHRSKSRQQFTAGRAYLY
jgi:uncharacterized DUF497 family protein